MSDPAAAQAEPCLPLRVERVTPWVLRLRIGAAPAAEQSYFAAPPPVFPGAVSDAAPAQGPWLRPDGPDLVLADRAGTEAWRLPREAAVSTPQGLRLRLVIAGEQHFYGLGHGGLPLDRLGVARHLSNAHVNHGGGSDIAIPLLLSHQGYGLFFDATAPATLDPGCSGDETAFVYRLAARSVDLYVLMGTSLRDTLNLWAQLIGRPALPPRWSLGFLQSTRHFACPAEIEALAQEFRRRDLPCDGLIFLSSYGPDRGWNTGVGHLDPEPTLFTDLAEGIESLHRSGFRVVLHEYPVLHADAPEAAEAARAGFLLDAAYPRTGSYFQGQRFIDFTRGEAGDWWWDRHARLVAAGVDGWWLDGGEGPAEIPATRNRYDLGRQAAFARGEARDRPQHRPFLLCRSGGPGMAQCGAVAWSGDVNNSFTALEAQLALGLNLGLSGVPFWGTDIGGYYTSLPEDAELFARWFQFAAFTPLFRAHGRDWRHRLPWSFGPEIEAICRAFLNLRYRLMPYTYTLAWQAHHAGLPLMRPLLLGYPDDPRLRDVSTAYLWGDDILIAPVTRGGARHWPMILPAGTWIDFWTGMSYAGGGTIEVLAPLERMPILMRAGALIPTFDDPSCRTLSAAPDLLTLLVYPGAAGGFTLYEDDGVTREPAEGGCATTLFAAEPDGDSLTLRINAPSGAIVPPDRRYRLRVHAPQRPASVVLVGQNDPPVWSHDGGVTLVIDIPSHPATVRITW